MKNDLRITLFLVAASMTSIYAVISHYGTLRGILSASFGGLEFAIDLIQTIVLIYLALKIYGERRDRIFEQDNMKEATTKEIDDKIKIVITSNVTPMLVSIQKNLDRVDKRFDVVDEKFDKINEHLIGLSANK